MNQETETSIEPPQCFRAAVAYVTDYLLHHPPTYEREIADPPRPSYLLDAVMLLRGWLHEAPKTAYAASANNGRGEGWSL